MYIILNITVLLCWHVIMLSFWPSITLQCFYNDLLLHYGAFKFDLWLPTDEDDDTLLQWLQDQLDAKKQGGKAPADNLPLSHCVRYRVKMGLNAKVEQVYGLPGESSQTWLD